MPVHIRDEGQYELFETTKRHEILVLNGEKWYSVVEGQAGEIIVLTDSDHEKDHTVQQGRFKFADFEEDPTFRDMPHLFLESDGRYEEAILPQGFPTQSDKQKKIIRTGDKLPKDEVEDYLAHPAPAGPGEARMRRPGGGSISNVAHHLKGIDLPAKRGDVIRYAEQKDAPKAVIEQLKEMPDRQYRTMADITKAIGEGKEPLPIEEYDDLSASEITARLDELSEEELKRIRDYEEKSLNRKTILQKIDQKLELSDTQLPIEGYVDMRADEITRQLADLNRDELQRVREFEGSHEQRRTVMEAIDRELSG